MSVASTAGGAERSSALSVSQSSSNSTFHSSLSPSCTILMRPFQVASSAVSSANGVASSARSSAASASSSAAAAATNTGAASHDIVVPGTGVVVGALVALMGML